MPHDQELDNDFKESLDKARKISPLGFFPPELKKRFKIDFTPNHGGDESRGVFTKQTIKENDIIGELRGRIDTKKRTGRTKKVLDYALAVAVKGVFQYEMLCHNEHDSSWLRLINRPNTREVANVAFVLFEYPMPGGVRPCGALRVIVQATKDIRKGTQLLADYE
jgi:hypothetical protein